MKRNLMLFIILIIQFVLITACSHKNKETNVLTKYKTIKIAVDDSVANHQILLRYYYNKNSSESFLYFFNEIRNTIEIYNIDSKKLFKLIRLHDPIDYDEVYIQNFDSIFYYNRYEEKLRLCNIEGDIYKTWNFHNDLRIKNSDDFYEASFFSGESMQFLNNKIYINVGAPYFPKKFYLYNILLIYDLNTNSGYTTITFPDNYLHNKDFAKYGSDYCIANDKLVFSYQVNHNIYIYDLKGNFVKSYPAKSNYLENFPYLDPEDERNMTAYRKIRDSVGEYVSINYDPYEKLYYRIVSHNYPQYGDKNRVYHFLDNNWSIIFLDTNFKIIAEQAFPGKKYDIYSIFPTNEGFMIMENPKFDKYNLTFDIFKINKDKIR